MNDRFRPILICVISFTFTACGDLAMPPVISAGDSGVSDSQTSPASDSGSATDQGQQAGDQGVTPPPECTGPGYEMPFDGVDSDCDGADTFTLASGSNVLGSVGAYSANSQSLVVWQNKSGSNHQLQGIPLAQGQRGNAFSIANATSAANEDWVPSVTWDGIAFVVSWLDPDAVEPDMIYARRVGAQAAATSEDKFVISSSSGYPTKRRPRVWVRSGQTLQKAFTHGFNNTNGQDGSICHAFAHGSMTTSVAGDNSGDLELIGPHLICLAVLNDKPQVNVIHIDGDGFGNHQQLDSDTVGEGNVLRLASSSNTEFLAVWTDVDSGGALKLRRFSTSGTTTSVSQPMVQVVSQGATEPRVVHCNGNYHVVYRRGNSIERQVVGANGPVGSPETLFSIPASASLNSHELICEGAAPVLVFGGEENGQPTIGAMYLSN